MSISTEESFLNARTGSLVAGIVLSIISSLMLLGSIGSLIFCSELLQMLDVRWSYDMYGNFSNGDLYILVFTIGLILMVFCVSAVDFSFSVVLAHGASKSKAGQLKTYYIYGNVKTVLLLVLSIALYFALDSLSGCIALAICGVNSMLTYMVYVAYINTNKQPQTYFKFDNDVLATKSKELHTMSVSKEENSCCNARVGSLVVGVIQCILSTVVVLASLGAFVYINVLFYENQITKPFDINRSGLDDLDSYILLISNGPILTVFFMSLMDLSFSIILAHGALKRKAGYLKAYFTYGNIKTVMLLIIGVTLCCTLDILLGSVSLISCVFSSMLTYMVYVAQRNISKQPKGYYQFDNEVVLTKSNIEALK